MEEYLKRLPPELKEVISCSQKVSERLGFRAYLVGGFVRDLILGVPNLDMDIVIEGDGLKFAEELCAILNAKLTRHRRFGTATITAPGNFKIDVATARKETYAHPAALPNVTAGDIQDDLLRRDFTINAMAISISSSDFGKFVDFFGGKSDLMHGHIRVMHDLSFIDDPTRILRAIRFEQRYHLKIETHTYKLLKSALERNMLEAVDKQRIRDELILMLKENEPIRYIKRANKLLGLSFISPKIRFTKSLAAQLYKVEKEINWFKSAFPRKRLIDAWLLYLIVLLKRLKKREVLSFANRYALRTGEVKRIISFEENFDRLNCRLNKKDIRPSRIYRLLEPLSYEVIILIKAVSKRRLVKKHIADFLKVYNGMRLHVNGEDLKKMGLKPGPSFKKLLLKLLYAKIDYGLKTREEELNFISGKFLKESR
ncbi:MAG: hypothetical protein NC914_02795 [Candidatus Omnitrophica bacterium]|nr:hypothetical protein [Candidatus Omnitrophota bacterium]